MKPLEVLAQIDHLLPSAQPAPRTLTQVGPVVVPLQTARAGEDGAASLAGELAPPALSVDLLGVDTEVEGRQELLAAVGAGRGLLALGLVDCRQLGG